MHVHMYQSWMRLLLSKSEVRWGPQHTKSTEGKTAVAPTPELGFCITFDGTHISTVTILRTTSIANTGRLCILAASEASVSRSKASVYTSTLCTTLGSLASMQLENSVTRGPAAQGVYIILLL